MLGCFNPNLGQIWTNPNAGLKITVESESWSWVYILNDIFNPTFGFVHIWTKFDLKQPSIVRVYSLQCHMSIQNAILLFFHSIFDQINASLETKSIKHIFYNISDMQCGRILHWLEERKSILQTMLGCFNPDLGRIWTNPNVGLKCNLKFEPNFNFHF